MCSKEGNNNPLHRSGGSTALTFRNFTCRHSMNGGFRTKRRKQIMYWYKVRIRQGDGQDYSYVGSMPISPEELAEKLFEGQWVRLESLLQWDGTKFHDWKNWDSAVEPTLYLSPTVIIAFMQLKGDPRQMPKEMSGQEKKGLLGCLFARN